MSPQPTVLIVDDDRLNRALLAELLKDDCRLLLAKDGLSGLDIAQREDVSLILLDVSMPGMDGYEVMRRLRANPETADIGVIFITGMAEEEDEEKGLMLGAADYVQKPIRPAIVKARVKVHLKLAAQRRELERLSLQDGLTGIANRRYFDDAFERCLRRAARQGEALGVAIFDVDHFKQYNDFYGHGAGDEALRQVAAVFSHFTRRPGDVAARYGGEEFRRYCRGVAPGHRRAEHRPCTLADISRPDAQRRRRYCHPVAGTDHDAIARPGRHLALPLQKRGAKPGLYRQFFRLGRPCPAENGRKRDLYSLIVICPVWWQDSRGLVTSTSPHSRTPI